MAGSQDLYTLKRCLRYRTHHHTILASNTFTIKTSHALNHQVITGQGPSLVKATNLNFPTKRNAEWFCTKDTKLGERQEGGIDSQAELSLILKVLPICPRPEQY